MALKEWNIAPGGDKVSVGENTSVTAVTAAASSLGGTYGVRVLIDDAICTDKAQMLRLIDIIQQTLVQNTWPPT